MIELTEQQRQELSESTEPVRVVDSATRREYFLVRAEDFARLKAALGDLDLSDTYPAIDRAFAANWDDPKMADYDHYESRKRCPIARRLPQSSR